MPKEIIAFPSRERLWFRQNKKELADIIREEFSKYNSRAEVLDEDGIAPGSSKFFKKILTQALDKEIQPDFDIEKLYAEAKDELKKIFYSINKEYKTSRDLGGLADKGRIAGKKNKADKNKITGKDFRGAFIINSQPEEDR